MLPPGGTAVTSTPASLSTEPDRKRLRTSNSLAQEIPAGFRGWTSTVPTDHVVNMSRVSVSQYWGEISFYLCLEMHTPNPLFEYKNLNPVAI